MLTLKKNFTHIRRIVLLIIFLQLCQYFALGQPPLVPLRKHSRQSSDTKELENFRSFFQTARTFRCEDTFEEAVLRFKALATLNLKDLTAQDIKSLCNNCRFAIINTGVNRKWCDSTFKGADYNDPKAVATCFVPLKNQCKTCKDIYCEVIFSKKLSELKGNLFKA